MLESAVSILLACGADETGGHRHISNRCDARWPAIWTSGCTWTSCVLRRTYPRSTPQHAPPLLPPLYRILPFFYFLFHAVLRKEVANEKRLKQIQEKNKARCHLPDRINLSELHDGHLTSDTVEWGDYGGGESLTRCNVRSTSPW